MVVITDTPFHNGAWAMLAASLRRNEADPPAGKARHARRERAEFALDPFHAAGSDSLESFALAAAAMSDADKCLVPIPLDLPEGAGDGLAAMLSTAERQRAARFRRLRDRQRYIVAHARLRELLAQRLGVGAGQVALGNNRHGKPELVGRQAASGWHFNLSYSDGAGGRLALCAFSRRGRIGVDVESVRPLDETESLARQFFSSREYGLYRRLGPVDRLLGFFNGWTRKEAFVKALGTGLSHDLSDFDVSLAPGRTARILRVGGLSGERCGWHLESVGPVGGRVAAVVTEQTGG